jgi:hypothetical protein
MLLGASKHSTHLSAMYTPEKPEAEEDSRVVSWRKQKTRLVLDTANTLIHATCLQKN